MPLRLFEFQESFTIETFSTKQTQFEKAESMAKFSFRCKAIFESKINLRFFQPT